MRSIATLETRAGRPRRLALQPALLVIREMAHACGLDRTWLDEGERVLHYTCEKFR